MDGIEMLKTRRSIRTFAEKKVEDKIIKEIINCARLAPTANNVQPWIFVVVRNKELKNKIAQITGRNGSFISQADVCITIFCDDVKYYLEDGCAATENILLSARYYGLGSCWVAGDKKDYAQEVKKVLNVPENYKLISIIPLGYVEEKVLEQVQNITKKPIEEIMFIDKFDKR